MRHFVQDDAAQAHAVRMLFRHELSVENPGWINRVVLCELVWVLERAYRCTREQIIAALEALAQTAEFRLENLPAVWRALRAYKESGADFANAFLAVTNRECGCEVTVTFDRKAARLDGMRVL